MQQQKVAWIYSTRVNNHPDVSVSKSGKSNVTSVCVWPSGGDEDKSITTGIKATALFSYFIVPQPAQDPRSMKFNSHPKHSTPHVPVPDKLPNITTSNFYDDPAFSPDPLSNPFFSSNQPPAWSTPPGPGHPTLKKRRPVNGEEFYPPQPPNTPAVPEPEAPDNRTSAQPQSDFIAPSSPPTIESPDNRPSTESSSSSPPIHLASSAVASTLSSSASTDPSSSEPHVHPKVDMPHDAHPSKQHPQQPSSSKPEPKKRPGFFSRLLGSSPGVESSDSNASSSSSSSQTPSSTDSAMLRMQPPPPYDMGPRPVHVPRHHPARSAPELYRSDRPVMPPRAKTVGTSEAGKVVPAVAAAAGRVADDRRLRQDLDKIDELDESNPFGAAIHHGGPYEAISRFVQKDSTPKQHERVARAQPPGGRGFMMSGDVYRNAQITALQKGSLGLKPGQILPRDFAPPPHEPLHEPLHPHPYPYPHPHPPPQPQPQPSRHHDHHAHHAYPQPSAPTHEPRPSLERPMPTQMVPSVPQPGSLGKYSGMDAVSLTDSKPTRRRTPSPTAATTHSSEDDDAGLAIGMALMGDGQNDSHASSDTGATVVASETDSSPRSSIKIVLREPTDEPSPPSSVHNQPSSSPSRTQVPHEYRSQEPAVTQNHHRGEAWDAPPAGMTHPEPIPQGPMSQFVPAPAPVPSPSRHTSWHLHPSQAPPPQQYSRSSRHEIYSLQPQPLQQRVAPVNPGLSRSSTYALGSSGPYTDRSMLASSLKAGGGTPPSSSTPSLRDRESDTRSVQQSIMTMSNASSRSQGGENPRRNRYLPKRLVMPAPLQPTLQNQATTHQIRFDPQANAVYPRNPSPPKIKPSSLAPPPRAQDIPMAPSNGKLRKRISLIGGLKPSKEPPAPPVAAVSFSANIVSADRNARGAERAHKKVLSKRK